MSRAQLHVILRRTDGWKDGRRSRRTDDTDVLLRIHHVIGELPTYGYRRVWARLRRQAELDGMSVINAKRVYRIMRQNALLLERKPAVPPSKRAHTGRVAVKESNQRWCSDEFMQQVDAYIRWYNEQRIKLSLGAVSPKMYRQQCGLE